MKIIKIILTISTIIGTMVTIYTITSAVLFVLTSMGIVDEEDLDYLSVSSGLLNADGLTDDLTSFDGFKFVSPQTDQMLKEIGGQKGSDDCLEYAQKYAHWILNNNAGYQVIGSSSEKAILQVAAFELYKKRPVITRVNGGSEVKKNGLPMHSRHFVTIIRNKGKC